MVTTIRYLQEPKVRSWSFLSELPESSHPKIAVFVTFFLVCFFPLCYKGYAKCYKGVVKKYRGGGGGVAEGFEKGVA